MWKAKIEKVMEEFLFETNEYPIEEFDILISLFEGGEYEGLNTGAYGKDKQGNKFTAVGFVNKWYDLSTPDGENVGSDFSIQDVSPDLDSKDKYLLAIYYDDKHPERNDMFLAVPDEVTITTTLSFAPHEFLLNKDRLNSFLKSMEIESKPDSKDPISLTKRCVGMKILVEHIMLFGDKLAELFEEEFRNKFIGFLLKECAVVDEKKSNLKCEWYEQRLYALKKFATESQTGLRINSEKSIMFKGKHLTITTKIEDTNEMYYEQIKMESAVNYGYVTQGKQYLIVDSNHVLSSMYRNDHIAVMSSDNINTPEKLHEVFQHLDIVVTSDLDLKEMHDKMVLSGDKKVAYFKTVILLNHNSFVHLQEVIEVGVKVKRASSADMTDHEQLCNEIETFLNISKEDAKEIFKDKETAPLTDKITAFSSWVRKRNGDDKEDKKEDKKKEEEKKDVVKDYNPLAYVTSFGLLNNEQLRNNMGELSSYASNNYSSDPPITTKKGELYDKVYQIKPDDVIGEYTNTLSSLYKQLCRKTLSSFFANLSLEKLLDIVLISEENFDLFTKYIQIRGNDAVKDKRVSGSKVEYDNFLNLMQKIISVCVKEEKFIKLIDIIIKKVLIQGSYTIINESLKNKNKKINDAFNNDSAALKGLNLNLVPDLIKNLMKDASHKIYENEDDFMNLLTILIMIPLTYREEKLFSKNIYMAVYKLLMPIASQSDKYSLSLKSKVLNFKLLKEVFDKVNFNLGINDYSWFTNEQKILFELYLLIRQLDESTEDITSIFAYPDKILEVERCKIILKELKKFDMVAYLTYYHKELTEEEKTSKIFEETLHNRYKGKVSAKFQYSGIKKIGVKVSEDTKLEGTSCIGFSTDPEGHNIVKSISQIEIDEKKLDVAINSTMFYVHYPYNSHKVICWGYGSDYKFGNNNTNTTTNPIQLQDFTKPIKQIHSQYNRTVILGEDGCIYYSGYVSEWGGYKYYMGKYDSGMPESPIVDLKVGNYNIAVMTEDHKIYIQGTDSGYHIDNCNSKYTLYHKERPNEEDEKIIAWDLGYYHHIYVTDNGKCYGAGNDFMRGIDLECNSKSYVEIKFDEGVVPKRPVCNHLSDTYKPCLMFVENNGKSELWSAGYTNYGLLGQGEGKNESKKWAPLNYDKDTIHFVDASIRYYAGMARTDDGRLFAWGSNNSGQIGLPERKYYYSPVEIPFFKDYYTHEFSCGDYHAMICASPLNHMEKKQIFLMGDIKGLNDTSGKNADGIYHFKKFDD